MNSNFMVMKISTWRKGVAEEPSAVVLTKVLTAYSRLVKEGREYATHILVMPVGGSDPYYWSGNYDLTYDEALRDFNMRYRDSMYSPVWTPTAPEITKL